MGKYDALIDGMIRNGRAEQSSYEALVKAELRAFPAVTGALRSHECEDIRELCAEILGEWGYTKAIPPLMIALRDPSFCVRQDALWSIEKICLYQPGGLYHWLDLDWHKPDEMDKKMRRWWRKNREYFESRTYL